MIIQSSTTNHYRPFALWLTGLSGAGKSTTATHLQAALTQAGCKSYLLDGDLLRQGLCKDLGFSKADRNENIRRVGEVAKLMVDAGLIVISATISPFQQMRNDIRARFAVGEFIEVFIDAPLNVCESRDPKGLYRRARAGELAEFTGVDSVYEVPTNPELHLRTDQQSPQACIHFILNYLRHQNYLSGELKELPSTKTVNQ